jgi:cysteine desulfurase family protein (TIGR01976 family)
MGDRPVAWLDGPGGTQTPAVVIDAMAQTLRAGVSNLSPLFAAGRDAIGITDAARQAMADLFGTGEPRSVIFGQNMTSLTFAMSRAIARTWQPGDEILVTRLDHDANVTPWLLAAADRGVMVHRVDITDDGRLDLDDLDRRLSARTKLVAVTAASNALGTVADVAEVARRAHAADALVYVDAVHATAHRLPDVSEVDFLACSAYKFFGPHTGIVYGRLPLLEELDAYKVRPAPDGPPGKWETGTQSFESLAGVSAAVDYLANLSPLPADRPRRERLVDAYDQIADHERSLAQRFLDGLAMIPGVRLWGTASLEGRVATFAITLDGARPDRVARRLGDEGIFVWSGHYYALEVMERLDLLDRGGAVRIGFVHYNTIEEVDRALDALGRLARNG